MYVKNREKSNPVKTTKNWLRYSKDPTSNGDIICIQVYPSDVYKT